MNAHSNKILLELMTREVEPAPSPPASAVLTIFGTNLRLLTSLRGTQARAAAALDIGRVQFQRYLRGESFPKPHILKRICDYFGVDARIMTELLTEPLLEDMFQARNPGATFPHRAAWMSALGFAAPEQNYFEDTHRLESGLHAVWTWCPARKDTVVRLLYMISEEGGAKVFRGYIPRDPAVPGAPLKEREFRGLCLNMSKGCVFLTFGAQPSQMISTAFVTPTHLSDQHPHVFTGTISLNREELPDKPHLSQIVIERVDSTPGELARLAHAGSFFKLDEIPEDFASLLSCPMG